MYLFFLRGGSLGHKSLKRDEAASLYADIMYNPIEAVALTNSQIYGLLFANSQYILCRGS